jgi:hypothetical protein
MAATKSSAPDLITLNKRWEEAKLARQDYEKNWDKAREMYNGEQWKGISKIAWFQSEPVFNKIFEFVETMRGYLSDNKWGIDVVPAVIPKEIRDIGEEAQLQGTQEALGMAQDLINDTAAKVDKLLDFLWMDNRMQNKLAQVLQYVFLYGTGLMKASFDAENVSASGIGQIETTVLSPWYIFPDPAATSVQDASYIIEHHPVSLRWIQERYPEAYVDVKENAAQSTTEYSERRGDTGRGPIPQDRGKFVDVFEAWYTDATIDEDSDGNISQAYPSGRMTLYVKGGKEGGIVLEDKANPYQQWPYVRFVEIPRPAEFFGDATVHKVIGIQQTINQILRSIIDNGLWLVHGIWIADSTSGVTPTTLAGYGPRDTVVKHPGTDVHRDAGQALPSHMFQLLESQVQAFNTVTGFEDVLRGIVPSRQPVQTTMMQQEAGEVRTRERQRRVEEALEDLGKIWLDIVSEYWSDKRVIRNRKLLGGFEMFDISKKDLAEWKFDIHVIPGSTTPIDTAGLLARAFELQQNGVELPPNYLVRLSRLPGLEQAMTEAVSAMQEQEAPPEQEEMEAPEAAPQPSPEEMMAMEQAAMMQQGAPPMPAPQPTPEELAMAMQGPMA